MSRADRIVEATAKDIIRLPDIKSRLAEIDRSNCRNCMSLTYAYLMKQAKQIEDGIARLSPRLLRISRKHAANLLATRKG